MEHLSTTGHGLRGKQRRGYMEIVFVVWKEKDDARWIVELHFIRKTSPLISMCILESVWHQAIPIKGSSDIS